MDKHLIHKHSSVAGKTIGLDKIEFGEIAVNYAVDQENITIKNSGNKLVKFLTEKQVNDTFVNVTGDTMSGNLNVEGNVSFGSGNTVTGTYAFAQGDTCVAKGHLSHAEGWETQANGDGSHAEGTETKANGDYSHAEGINTQANGEASHAEGSFTKAYARVSHAEGIETQALGLASHTEGYTTRANGDNSHAEGHLSQSNGKASHAEGDYTVASGDYSHAEGYHTEANGEYSHAEGIQTEANNFGEHANGFFNVSISSASQDLTALTADTQATLFSIGNGVDEQNRRNAFEIKYNGDTYIPEGNVSIGKNNSFTFTDPNTLITTTGKNAFAQGEYCIANGTYSHAEGHTTRASGDISHSEGYSNQAIGTYSHAEGRGTEAFGKVSHTEGSDTKANGECSHAEGVHTQTNNYAEHANGVYNASFLGADQDISALTKDAQATLFSIGNGYIDMSTNPQTTVRKNAFEVKYNGDAYLSGNTKFDKTVNVKGATELGSTLLVKGDTTINSKLKVDGTTSLQATTATTINAENISVSEHLHALSGGISELFTIYLDSDNVNANIITTTQMDCKLINSEEMYSSIGTIDTLSATEATIYTLSANTLSANTLSANTLSAAEATIAYEFTAPTIKSTNISATTVTAPNLVGNSSTATKLQTARTIALSGDVTGTTSFDGSGNVTIASVITPLYAASPSKGGPATSANKVNSTLSFASGTFAAKTFNGSAAVTVNVPTATSHLSNNSDFATNESVDTKITAAEGKEIHLTGVTGSANGTMTFAKNQGTALTFDSKHTHPTSEVTGLDTKITNITNSINSINTTLGKGVVLNKVSSLKYNLLVDGDNKGEIDIPKDQFLNDASYDTTTNELVFNFTTSGGNEETRIGVGHLIDTYTAGNGLLLADNKFSIDTSVTATKDYVNTGLNGKSDTGHGHVIGDVSGLQTALDGKQPSGSYASSSHNHSGTYANASHTHTIANVTNLQSALDDKSDNGHTHNYAAASHSHSGYASSTHSHSQYVLKAGDTMTGSLTVKGTISATSQVYSSDISLKENIEVIKDTDIEAVRTITPKAYAFKEDMEHRVRYGTIAQEVEQTSLSELVYEDEMGIKGVDYISYLIIKCEQLQRDLNSLQNKFDELSK